MTTHIADKKIIKDTVHGYIYIRADYCYYLLDTPEFQRLKRLEQTNLRPLYPCAHHDRFVHSLGTFHLGEFAFQAIKSNSSNEPILKNINWKYLQTHFEVACLLHDIGHSPFSHTLEHYFNFDNTLDDEFDKDYCKIEGFKMEYNEFIQDYHDLLPKPKPHERTSAILVLTRYKKVLSDSNIFGLNPYKIGRAHV